MTDKSTVKTSDRLVLHLVRRMLADGRVAYFFGPPSETFHLLTTAAAEHEGRRVEDIQQELWARCRTECVRTLDQVQRDLEIHLDEAVHDYRDEYVSLSAAREIVRRAFEGLPGIDVDALLASRSRRNVAIDAMCSALGARHGARIRYGARARFSLAGITSTSEAGVVGAARNWCMAARKRLLTEGAQ